MLATSAGDLGDLVYLLGVLSEVPNGPHTLLLQTSSETKIKTDADLKRFADMVIPLAKRQPYIADCRILQGDDVVDWRSQGFRGKGRWCPMVTLLGAKAYHLQMCLGYGQHIKGQNAWLSVDPMPAASGRVIINRTGRYRNPYFPWPEIVNFYGDRLVFVGQPHEYLEFCSQFGMVEFHRTHHLLEVAEIIAGSDLFIGNQSCANACAEGLKHRLIQETALDIPDCIFIRPNAQHVADGACVLPGFDGQEDRVIAHRVKVSTGNTAIPPDGWQYPRTWPDKILRSLVERVARMENIDKKDAEDKIVAYNTARIPDFFSVGGEAPEMATVRQAMRSAQAI